MEVRPARVVRLTAYVAVLGLLAVAVAAVVTGRYQVRPILSGSMAPGLPVGGIVVTQRVPISDVQVRDVVVFHRPDRSDELITHRIISLTSSASGPVIQTQGDANTIPDPWKVTMRGDTAYRAAFTVPVIGYAAVWAHGPIGADGPHRPGRTPHPRCGGRWGVPPPSNRDRGEHESGRRDVLAL